MGLDNPESTLTTDELAKIAGFDRTVADDLDSALASSSGVSTADIDDGAVTFAKMQDVATSRLLGRVTAGTGDIEALTGTQATTLLDTVTTTLKGLAPASGGGTTNYLRADGSWAKPPGGILVYNVKDSPYSATGDGATDDTSAIQSAIAACNAAGGGIVFIPVGTYRISRTLGYGDAGCLRMLSGVLLLGESRTGTILKLVNNTATFTRPISTNGATDASIRNFTIDGNKANQATPSEHRAGIFTDDCARIYIGDMTMHDNTGDGVLVHANGVSEWSEDVVIERCYMYDNDRKGVSVTGGSSKRITMRECQFVNNYGSMHVENEEAVYDVTVERCYCGVNAGNTGYCLSFGGGNYGNRNQGAYVRDCVINGSINIIWQDVVRITGNRIAQDPGGDSRPVNVQFDTHDVEISDNDIYLPDMLSIIEAAIYLQGALDVSYYQPDNTRILNNRIRVGYALGHGVQLVNPGNVLIEGNQIMNELGASNCSGAGVTVSATITTANLSTKHITVNNNRIYNFQNGVVIGASVGSTSVESLTAIGNLIQGANNPLVESAFELNQANDPLIEATIIGNTIEGYSTPVSVYPTCPIKIGGMGSGTLAIYSCNGTPEAVIADGIGAMALRRDGGAGTTLYIKESGTGNTGWVAK